jgi:N-acetylglucosaminyldiphosphoundecaprenol N-acetyl-beta-D-mannosaminyltransferase
VPFDPVTQSGAIAAIERMIASRQPHYLVTPNVDFLVQARRDVELRRILLDAHLVLCDGTPLLWVSRLLGNPLPERVAGADLVPQLLQVAARKGYRVFLLGATPKSCDRAVARLREAHPELLVAGHYSPPFRQLLEMNHDEINRRIREAAPDILLVSFGCPKQEKWIAMNYRQLGVPVAIGVGATIDFLAGEVHRAPLWMQRSGTEWVYRLCQEPRRLFRRYAKDLCVFGWGMLPQWYQLQARRPRRLAIPAARQARLLSSAACPAPPMAQSLHSSFIETPLPATTFHLLSLPERLDYACVQQAGELERRIIDGARHCLLEAQRTEFIDSTGVGWLVRLQKQLREGNRLMALVAPSRPVCRALALMRLLDFFLCAPDAPSACRLILARLEEQPDENRAPDAPTPGSLAWRGEVTAANAEWVWQETLRQISASPAGADWVLDLSAVRFMDSTGLGLLVRAAKLARQQGRHLVLSRVPKLVRNVIRLSRLDALLLPAAPHRLRGEPAPARRPLATGQ